MLTIYSPVQRTHRPAYVVKQGERSASFDIPERVDSILSTINKQELGPILCAEAGHDSAWGWADFLLMIKFLPGSTGVLSEI